MKRQNRKKTVQRKLLHHRGIFTLQKKKRGKLGDILNYDVTESNLLYGGDVVTKREKSKIIGEIHNFVPEQSILHDLGGMKMDNT